MFDVTTLWAIPSQGWTFGVSPPGRRNRGVPIFEFAIASFARNRLVSSVVVPRQQRVGFTEAAEGLHTPRVLAPSAACASRCGWRIGCCCRGLRHCGWRVGRCCQTFGRCRRRFNPCCLGPRHFTGTGSRTWGMVGVADVVVPVSGLILEKNGVIVARGKDSRSIHVLVLPRLLLCPKPRLPTPVLA